ncbi:sodium/calcium exchanger NCL1-like [Vitis riparia]|uniref:sodium/calcium exchanger NCL1-like n=1 Tax=Vitis riparia TaxID=96939 RepID=UPI00155A3A29|nr:sodium/calcium exchanger NCL1-like [Vitis riparia]
MAKKHTLFLLAFLFLMMLINGGKGQGVADNSAYGLVSDGVGEVQQSAFVVFKNWASSDSCHQTYGFLPCTTTVLGNIFLILVYGYLMFIAAKFLSDGSEILLGILGPGIIGGLFLPVLSAFPDAVIILASGLSGSKETAQSQVSIGMGLLAGSTVMLLTILWGSCIIVGKCDIENSVATDLKDTRGFSLTGSGVSTDIWASYAARIMVISVIPFIIVQISQLLHTTSQARLTVLISLIVSLSLLLSYCLYQVFQPRIQKRRLAYAKHKHLMSGILKHLKSHILGRLFTNNGEPNTEAIKKLFETIDVNSNGYLSVTDIRALIIGIQFDAADLDIDETVRSVMKDFDTTGDSQIDMNEFVRGMSRWLTKAKRSAIHAGSDGSNSLSTRYINDFNLRTREEQEKLEDQNEEEEVESIKNPKWNASKAVAILLLGTVVAAIFADPLVDAVDNFSTATSIPSFFVSFVVLPFASSSEAVSAMIFASRKKLRTASLTFSEIYGSVTMGNILSLSVFLGLIYFRQLTWDFASEVLIILIVCILMGVFAGTRTTFPLWTSLMAFLLYPLSLVLVYVLDNYLGWS